MNEHISYLIETNGENGVVVEWYPISYIPSSVIWDSTNTFSLTEELPDVESSDTPEYVRKCDTVTCDNDENYTYYRRTVKLPAKSTLFSVIVLIDGSTDNGGFSYDTFTSFFSITKNGDSLEVTSRDNLSGVLRDGVIRITSNQYGDSVEVYVVQDYTHLGLLLKSYTSEGIEGADNGVINALSFEYTFHWLTSQSAPEFEKLVVEVLATGPRNGFIVRKVEKYGCVGVLNSNYVYSGSEGKYYETLQKCSNEGLQTVYEEIIYDDTTQGVYRKLKYDNDLKIIKKDNIIEIINYGRCFLEDDAYYVITLSNTDDLTLTNEITIKYDDEDS